MYETTIAMFLLYLILNIIGFISANILKKKHFFHVTFKLYLSSIFIELTSYLFYLIEFSQYSISGLPTPGMQTTGKH